MSSRVFAVILLGALAFLVTLSEISLVALPIERVKGWQKEGRRFVNSLLILLEDRRKLLGFFELIELFVAAFFFYSLSRLSPSNPAVFLIGTCGYIFLCQFFPRRLGLYHIEGISRVTGPSVAILFRLLGWMESLADGFSTILANLFGREPRSAKPPLSSEEIKMLVSAGSEEPLDIEKEEKEMIQSVITFGETMVKEIMTPRIDMVCVDVKTTVSGVLESAIIHGYSKFPVYEETIDNIIGIVVLKDMYRFLREAQNATPLRELMRKPFFVPESKKVDDLLREMQRKKISMAIIVDEYGGTDGLVTLEDIVEEIVGEIADEHDAEIPDIVPVGERAWIVDGLINLEDLNEKLNLSFPTEEYETLSGYIYGHLGKVPKVGDRLETEREELEVMVVHRQRISKVKLTQVERISKSDLQERST